MAAPVIEPEREQARILTHPSLMWQNHTDLAINVPGQVLYEEVTADSTSTSGFSFNFRSPADNALMDNCVIIEYPITIVAASVNYRTDLNRYGGATLIDEARMQEVACAFRQCFAFARAIQNLSVTINGSNFNVQPIYWLDALNRLYFSEEEAATICSGSGGEFDGPYPDAQPYYLLAKDSTGTAADAATNVLHMSVGGNRLNASGLTTDIPVGTSRAYYNEGFDARWQRFLERVYDKYALRGTKAAGNSAPGGNADGRANIVAATDAAITVETIDGNANTGYSFVIYERLPIAPFLFHNSKDARMSIPNIRQVNITAQFATKLIENLLQGPFNGTLVDGVQSAAANAKSLSFNSEKCKLHCKWYLTSSAIPPIVRLRAPKYQQYIKEISFNSGAARNGPQPAAAKEYSFSNIQLDSIPDKFFIMVSRKPDEFSSNYPSEFYLSIKDITLTIGGSSGRLTSMNSYQMYENFLRQSAHGGEKKLCYDDWYKWHCCAILDAADIGLVAGPGYNYKTNLTVKLNVESYWSLPGIYNKRNYQMIQDNTATAFNVIVLCCYNQHYIELNSSGGSKSGMTMIPRM